MSAGTPADGARSAAEERLLTLIALLRLESPHSDDSLSEAIMRTARWQYVVRGVLTTLSELAAVLLDAVLLMTGLRRAAPSPA